MVQFWGKRRHSSEWISEPGSENGVWRLLARFWMNVFLSTILLSSAKTLPFQRRYQSGLPISSCSSNNYSGLYGSSEELGRLIDRGRSTCENEAREEERTKGQADRHTFKPPSQQLLRPSSSWKKFQFVCFPPCHPPLALGQVSHPTLHLCS